MCDYAKDNMCSINQAICPWRYLCPQTGQWRDNKYMPKDCKIKLNEEVPKGYHRVIEERKGWLYINMGDYAIRVKNPFDHTPLYVRVNKLKSGEYKIRE